MSDKQLSECLFPTTASKPVYKMPDYAYVHKELQCSGVTLNLLWPVYYDQCRAAGEINTQQSIQLLRELGGTPAAAVAPASQEATRVRAKAIAHNKRIQEEFQLCYSEEDFLNLRSQIMAEDILNHDKAILLEALNIAARKRLAEVMEKAKAYEESQKSLGSILLGGAFIIGFVCSYLFSVRWPWIVGVVIGGVLGFLGNIMEKNDKGKIKGNEQAVALIAAYNPATVYMSAVTR